MSTKRLPRHTCGAPTGQGRHMPNCTDEARREEGCWCFLYADEPKMTAREWRAGRRQIVRHRRRFRIAVKRFGFDRAWELTH